MPDPNRCRAARLALATIDGQTCTDTHFGEAPVYAIHAFDGQTFKHVQNLANPSSGEEAHGSSSKTVSILDLLAQHDVEILVARRFGPSIKKIQRSAVAVITGGRTASETFPELAQAWLRIQAAQQSSGETRQAVLAGVEGEPPPGKVSAQVEARFCRGCGRCVPSCPVDAIIMRQRLAKIDASRCVGCQSCLNVCPFGAITEFES